MTGQNDFIPIQPSKEDAVRYCAARHTQWFFFFAAGTVTAAEAWVCSLLARASTTARALVGCFLQHQGSPECAACLGDRIAHAFASVLAPGAAAPSGPASGPLGTQLSGAGTEGGALIIGTDCPSLGARELCAASVALQSADAVVGPAADGGFYLLGVRANPPPALFQGVAWSSAATRSDMLRNIAACGLRSDGVGEALQILRDIDTASDAAAWVRDCAASSARRDGDDEDAAVEAALSRLRRLIQQSIQLPLPPPAAATAAAAAAAIATAAAPLLVRDDDDDG